MEVHEDRKAARATGWSIDLDRCNGCGACIGGLRRREQRAAGARARERAHTASPGCACTALEAPGEARAAFVPLMCQQCGDKTPCASVCPQNAVERDPRTGIVAQIPVRCLGCRYCMAACPYHARSFNWWDPDWPGRAHGDAQPRGLDAHARRRREVQLLQPPPAGGAASRQAAAGRGREDAGRVHAGLRRGLPRAGDRLRQPRRPGERGRAARRSARMPSGCWSGSAPVRKVYYRTERDWVRRLRRRPHGDHRREDTMDERLVAARPRPRSLRAASCSGSRPGSALLGVGVYAAYLCLALGLNQTNMDNRFAFGLWIYLDLTVIALGAGAFFTGFLLYVLKQKRAQGRDQQRGGDRLHLLLRARSRSWRSTSASRCGPGSPSGTRTSTRC